jgi:hypothetical protein
VYINSLQFILQKRIHHLFIYELKKTYDIKKMRPQHFTEHCEPIVNNDFFFHPLTNFQQNVNYCPHTFQILKF